MPEAPLIPRRRFVAGAAWSAPAIVMATAAPAFAASACPSLMRFSGVNSPVTMSLILSFGGADSSWVATVTDLTPMPGASGFFTIPPPQNLFDDGQTRFDFPRTYRGGANEDFTMAFTLTKGTQVCTYTPVTINYFNRA